MRWPLASALIAILAVLEAPAQTVGEEAYPDKYPPALPARKGPPPPKFVFDFIGEVALPGPLPGDWLVLRDGRLRLPVEGGIAAVAPEVGAQAEIAPATDLPSPAPPAAPAGEGWVVAPSGELRFRIDSDGRIRAQRRSSVSKDGWRKAWTIRAPRAIPTPPLVVGARLFFAGLDDRLYAVRASNGHRLWTADVGERISRPLAHWSGTIPAIERATGRVSPADLDLLLVVPDGGGSLAAFDSYDGRLVGSFVLPAAQGWLTSPAVVVDANRVAVARQGYEPEQAALALFGLRSPDARPGPDDSAGEGPARPPL